MVRYGQLLTDAQWEKIQPLFPQLLPRPRGGRRPAHDRKVLEGILWILRSGARWQDLREEFLSPATCWRLWDWEEQGVWLTMCRAFLAGLNERQQLKWSESFLDGSFAPAKKGACRVVTGPVFCTKFRASFRRFEGPGIFILLSERVFSGSSGPVRSTLHHKAVSVPVSVDFSLWCILVRPD